MHAQLPHELRKGRLMVWDGAYITSGGLGAEAGKSGGTLTAFVPHFRGEVWIGKGSLQH